MATIFPIYRSYSVIVSILLQLIINDASYLMLRRPCKFTTPNYLCSSVLDNTHDAPVPLTTRFDRWKFLQQTLDGETSPLHVNQIIYSTLKPWLINRDLTENDSNNSSVSPQLSSKQYESLQILMDTHNSTQMIEALVSNRGFYKPDQVSTTLQLLETLHPDPREDEDAYKSCWDIVIELHGKESTRISEKSGDVDWKVRCSVVRLLIHFNFLIHDS